MSESATILGMLDELERQLGRETVLDLIDLFGTNSAEQVARIAGAFSQNDLALIKSTAHSLKSSSANLGAVALSEQCVKIEKATGLDGELAEWISTIGDLREEAVKIMASWKK